MIWASNQKVVTGFNCEVSSGSQEWHYTEYGPNGGTNGGFGSTHGRLFEFDCQTDSCFDSEGERSHYWVTCGYSWKEVDDLDDNDKVLVDVITWAHDRARSSCYGNYERALKIDATGWEAIDTSGFHGHWDFIFCYSQKPWKEVKGTQTKVVVDMSATTGYVPPGFTQIGQWDTHHHGNAYAYGNQGRTHDWLHLFRKKETIEVEEHAKVIGSWTFKTVSRPLLSDIEYEITKFAESSKSDEMSTAELNAWGNEISETQTVEVAVQADASYGVVSGSVSAAYGYEYAHSKSEQFENQLQNIASDTFTQSTEVTHSFSIPAQVEGEPVYSNIWFFQTEVINSDLETATHYQIDNGLEVHGCGYHIAPNCLPGYCAPYDPNCWTCSTNWAIIDPDFTAPAGCGDAGEGCDWVPVSLSECPPGSENSRMGDCHEGMEDGELCEADSPLPNGLTNYNINNCGWYDVFRYKCD